MANARKEITMGLQGMGTELGGAAIIIILAKDVISPMIKHMLNRNSRNDKVTLAKVSQQIDDLQKYHGKDLGDIKKDLGTVKKDVGTITTKVAVIEARIGKRG